MSTKTKTASITATLNLISPWVSVDDRLPPEDAYVLISGNIGWQDGFEIACFSKKTEGWLTSDDYVSLKHGTHWMPLPRLHIK